MKKITFLIFWELLFQCYGVQPVPVEKFWEEMEGAKNAIKHFANQLEKFNSQYLLNLEQKVLTFATTLTNIDANIKNLQERAHVWDTFQLHVGAWNEQISTLDKKVELISKSQEKILASDAKLNAVTAIEYKVERLLGKQDDYVGVLQAMTKLIENLPRDPLLGEFTARGVLSTLKLIERKVDKVQMQFSSSQSVLAKQVIDTQKSDEVKGKLLIKCNTPPKVEEILNDMASKDSNGTVISEKGVRIPGRRKIKKLVKPMKPDVVEKEEMHDDPHAEEDHHDPHDPHDHQETDSTEVTSDEIKEQDMKLVKGIMRRMNQPCRKAAKTLENLETKIKSVDNTTVSILKETQSSYHHLLEHCQDNTKRILKINSDTENIFNKIDGFMTNLGRNLNEQQQFLSTQLEHQREFLETVFSTARNDDNQDFIITRTRNINKTNHEHVHVAPTEAPYLSKKPPLVHKSNCEDLGYNYTSGVYDFVISNDSSLEDRSYRTRYCQKDLTGFWTVIQSRGINKENFSRSWDEYKKGFGDMFEDFWFGNDFIHRLTSEKDVILRIELEDFDGNMAYAEYTMFKVMSEKEKYKLLLGGYRGNATDSFSSHNGTKFSTYDQTNDNAPACCPCAPSYGGGWWFYSCFEANLNGEYYSMPNSQDKFRGIIWEYWLGDYSLKKTKMMVRPRNETDIETEKHHIISSTTDPTSSLNTVDGGDNRDEFIPEDP